MTRSGFIQLIADESGFNGNPLGNGAGVRPDHVHLIFRFVDEVMNAPARNHGSGAVSQGIFPTFDPAVGMAADDADGLVEIVHVIRQSPPRFKTHKAAAHLNAGH